MIKNLAPGLPLDRKSANDKQARHPYLGNLSLSQVGGTRGPWKSKKKRIYTPIVETAKTDKNQGKNE